MSEEQKANQPTEEPLEASSEAASGETSPENPTVVAAQADDSPTELETLLADLEKFRDLALRSQADFENYRKRTAREREEALRYANASLIEDLLPVVDNFELGLAAAAADPAAATILQGFSMVQRQLADFLKNSGVDIVEAPGGVPFDPKFHEALGHESHDEIAEGLVIRQLRRGYKLRDRLLRPATVFVSSGPAKASEATE